MLTRQHTLLAHDISFVWSCCACQGLVGGGLRDGVVHDRTEQDCGQNKTNHSVDVE